VSEHLPVSRPINLKGHAAIVTGSARGIGRAIAIAHICAQNHLGLGGPTRKGCLDHDRVLVAVHQRAVVQPAREGGVDEEFHSVLVRRELWNSLTCICY